MSSTVQVGAFQISGNDVSASEMVEDLTPTAKDDASKPRALVDKGKTVEPEDAAASEAARALGKRGGEAAARARREAAEGKVEAKPAEPSEKAPEGKAEPEDEKEPTPGKLRREDARTRVEQATRALAEERREKQALLERIERLEKAAKPAEPEPKLKPAPNGRPEVADYETYEEWSEALADWKVETKLKEREERQAQERQRRETVEVAGKRAGQFFERIDKGAGGDVEALKSLAPFLQALEPTFTIHPEVWAKMPAHEQAAADLAENIMDCDRPFEMVKYLSEHPDEYQRLIHSHDRAALLRGFGRVEAMLEPAAEPGEPEPKKPAFNPAPAPLRPLTPSAMPGEVDLMGDIPYDEYVRRMKARRA